MSDEVKARLFEPFFTTKGPGRGTGLGLATVHGIVKQSKGEISVRSAVGQGTTFEISFPWAEVDTASVARAAELRGVGGTETVLVVEDQEPVRNAVMRVLKAKGYRVLAAARPRDALELIAASREPVHLVLTDYVLPEMTGRDLVDLLRVARPGIGVLYMSGHAGGALNAQGVIAEGTPFLQKPFTPEGLGEKVRFALDQCAAKRN